MAHYAFLDTNNIVIEVISGRDESNFDWERYYGDIRGQVCKRTSYHTFGGEHIAGRQPFRKNFAGIGYRYDHEYDAFIPPQPYASWTLNQESCLWEPPTPMPTDNKFYKWNEETLNWEEVE